MEGLMVPGDGDRARKIKVRRNAYFTACKKILTWLKSVNVKAF